MEHAHTTPRLQSITGVSRALISTVGVEEAVAILIAQFGWDTSMLALARIDGPNGGRALWVALEHAVHGER